MLMVAPRPLAAVQCADCKTVVDGYVMISRGSLAVITEAIERARNHAIITCRDRCRPELDAALKLLDIAAYGGASEGGERG